MTREERADSAIAAAEVHLLAYVREHPNHRATEAINSVAFESDLVELGRARFWAARAALWHLVAYGRLKYSWDGLLSIPDVFIADGPQPHPDYPSVCMTCGDPLIEKDGLWVHAKGPKRGLRGKRVDRHEKKADVSA